MASNNIYNPRACGQLVPSVEVNPLNVIAKRAPTVHDKAVIGQIWINTLTNTVYQLTSFSSGDAIWTSSVAGGGGVFTTVEITGGVGDVLTVDMGNVLITAGDLNVINGTTSLGGDLDVNGDVNITGDFNLTSAASISLATTADVPGAITLQADGGTAETILIHTEQGTSATSIELLSDVGGITMEAVGNATANAINLTADAGGIAASAALGIDVSSSYANAAAITLNASDAAGGIVMFAGTGGFAVSSTDGSIDLESGTGDINIGADATAKAIVIGSITAGTTVEIDTATSFVLNGGIATTYSVGAATTTGTITIGGTAQTGNIVLGSSSGVGNIIIGGGTGATNVAIANSQIGGSIIAGLGMTTGAILLGGTAQTGNLTLGSSSGIQAVRIANGTGASVVTIANNQVAGSVSVGTAMTTGTISIGGTGLQTGTVDIAPGTGAQTINIGTGGTGVKTINIGTGAVANIVTIGATTGAADTTIRSGSNGITLDAPFVALPGPVYIYTGAGVPAGGLALNTGDLYINTTAATTTTRLYIATGAGVWATFTASA